MKITNTINLTNEEVAIANQVLEFAYPHQFIRKIQEAKEILNLMPIGQPMKCMDVAILTEVDNYAGITCQKTASLLKTLVGAGLVERKEEVDGMIEVEGWHTFEDETSPKPYKKYCKKEVPKTTVYFIRIA